MKRYKWKLKNVSKGVSPARAAKELDRIEKKYGKIIPELVVKESKSKNSVLHNFFEWNNDVAADNYRLQQAKNIINNIEIITISSGKPVNIGVYKVITKKSGSSYTKVTPISPKDIKEIKRTVLRDLKGLKFRISFDKCFEKTRVHIQKAIDSIKP